MRHLSRRRHRAPACPHSNEYANVMSSTVEGLLAREVHTAGTPRCRTGRPDGRLTNDDTNAGGRRAANRIVERASNDDTGDHRGPDRESMRRRKTSKAGRPMRSDRDGAPALNCNGGRFPSDRSGGRRVFVAIRRRSDRSPPNSWHAVVRRRTSSVAVPQASERHRRHVHTACRRA